MSTSNDWYELRNAVYHKDFPLAEQLLEKNPSLCNARNGIGETVLHFLSVENDESGVAWLSTRGFSIDTKNDFGTPAVFEVAQLGYHSLLNWFISSGADMTAKDEGGLDIRGYLLEYDKVDMITFLDQKNEN
jgi:ankyrin repeat protein